jgi:4-amino-4-deoxy-L-arabinose transferase-like glycosyltransferase
MFLQIGKFIQNDRIENRARFYAVLAVLIAAIAFTGLNGTLQDVDESIFSFTARDSLEGNSWLVQIREGEPTFFKSPMVFWASMISFKLFGISDFTAKLPAALANIVTAFAFFFVCRRVFNSVTTAFLAVLIYQCSLQVYISSHQVCTDVYFQLFMVLSLLFWMKAVKENRLWFILAGVFNGLVFLSKEGLGLILPAALFLFIVFDRNWKLLPFLVMYFLISLFVSIPYFLVVYFKIPESFVEVFIKEYLLKVASGGKSFNPFNKLYHLVYYFILLIAMLLPFSPGLIHILFRKNESVRTRDIIWNGDSKILTLFFFTCYIGFSLIGQHMPHYTLPMIPTLALYIAQAYTHIKKVKKVYLANVILAGIALAAFSVFTASRWTRYPTWRDVVIGLVVIYALFIALNAFLYIKSIPSFPGIILLVLLFFASFTITTAVTVPMDFNRDLRKFASLYEYPAPLYMVRTREISETGKQNPLYWYMRKRSEGYRDFESFAGSVSEIEKGSFVIFYKGDTGRMLGLFPSLTVLQTGRIWNIAKYE